MDDILQTIKLEVTLDCEQGASLDKVWSYAELAQRRIYERNGLDLDPVSVDDSMKRYLWPHIIQLREMIFLDGESILYSSSSDTDATAAAANVFSRLSLDEVQRQFPQLIVRASTRAIYKEIFGREEGNEKLIRSSHTYPIVQLLARAREKGMSQVQLTKTLNLDPRSTFHFIKVIDGEGLVVKYATYENGNNTNLWRLRRFAVGGPAEVAARGDSKGAMAQHEENPEDSMAFLVSYEMRKRVSDILEASRTGFMITTDLMDALDLDIWNMRHRKYFQRVIRDLSGDGFVEQVRLQVPDADQADPAECDNAPSGSGEDDNVEVDGESNKEAPIKTGKPKPNRGRKQTEEERRARRMKKSREKRGLNEGYSFRRCVRFIKPYVGKHK
ncbi:hypothetical protein EV174_003531, partial [Coemansia sp. RSA 2320]